MNPRGMDMVELALDQGREVELFSTLVGLRASEVGRLTGRLSRFVWHVPDNQGIAHIPLTDSYWATVREVLARWDINGYSRMDGIFKSNERAGNCSDAKPRHIKRFPLPQARDASVRHAPRHEGPSMLYGLEHQERRGKPEREDLQPDSSR